MSVGRRYTIQDVNITCVLCKFISSFDTSIKSVFKNACSHSAMNLPLSNVKYVHYVNVYDFSLLTTACGMCECMAMYVAHIH